MNTLPTRHKTWLLVKLISLAVLWAVIWLPLHSNLFSPLFPELNSASSFILDLVSTFILISVFQVGFLMVLIRMEKPPNIRQFFKIERLDTQGIWLVLGLGIILQILNVAFLWEWFLKPAKEMLASIGLAAPDIGLGTGSIVPTLSPLQALGLTIFLLVFWWIEAPEELFFRGYFQNCMQGVAGKNLAMLLSALAWDLAHLWSLANIVERFFYGLIYAFVFRIRQNTTGPMIVHPVGNRSLLLAATIPQIWGSRPANSSVATLMIGLGIYILLLWGVMLTWRVLKLDRQTS